VITGIVITLIQAAVLLKFHHYVPKTLDYLCEGSIFFYTFLIIFFEMITKAVDKDAKVYGSHQIFYLVYLSMTCITLLDGRKSAYKTLFRSVCFFLGVVTIVFNEELLAPIGSTLFGTLLFFVWIEVIIYQLSSARDRLITQQVKLEQKQKQLNFIVSQVPTGTAILNLEDSQKPHLEYANDAMLKVLNNISSQVD